MISRLVWTFILFAIIASAGASYYYNQIEEGKQARHLSGQVTSRLNDQLTVLEGVRALYLTSTSAGDADIRAYLRHVHTHARATGIQGVGVILATPRSQRAATTARIRTTYGPDAKIWPDSESDLSYPIILIEPFDSLNSGALGFDMYSDPTRRRAIQQAWTTGQASASQIVRLIQTTTPENQRQPGFIIFLPVIDPSKAVPTVYSADPADRLSKEPVEAFVYAPVRVHGLINAMLGNSMSGIAGVQVFAGTEPGAQLIYSQGKIEFGSHDTVIRIANREWKMVISYQANFNRYGRPLIILLFGIAIAALVAMLTRGQQRRLKAYQALAAEKARNAEDRELIIGEMGHRIKNAFARIGALARITLRESQSLQEFESIFDGRLRALADTKQMMIAGDISSLDLARLIQRELDLAGWPAESFGSIHGPAVHLDHEGAQAIALVIHELVTNSIKYGALSGNGKLSVQWERANGRVTLRWVESELAVNPIVDQESFGSHFVRSLVQRQLKGDWSRTAEKRQLTVQISWEESTPNT